MSEIPKRIHCGWDICDSPYWSDMPGITKGRATQLYISAAALRELVDGMSKEAAAQGSGDGLFGVLVSELRKLLEGA